MTGNSIPKFGVALPALAVGFAMLALALLGAGYWAYWAQAVAIRQSNYDNIAAVARMKAGQIVQWRQERLADVVREANSPEWIEALGKTAGIDLAPEVRDRAMRTLEVAREGGLNSHAIALSASGQVLCHSGAGPVLIEAATRRAIELSLADPKGALSDFFRSPDGVVNLDAVAAVRDAGGKPVGFIVLRIRADAFLYPLIQSWPTPSRSAETLLVEREGNALVFLNELRHRSSTALSLREPLSETNLPAVQAVLGRRGLFDGKDYRNRNVMADLRAIPGTPWFMVAKVDSDELMAEARYRATTTGVIVAGAILLAAAAVAFVYGRRQTRLFRLLFEAERQKWETQERFRTILYSIGDAVITTDTESAVRTMNPVAERLTGWTEAEAVGKALGEVFPIVNQQTGQTVINPVSSVLQKGEVVCLANNTVLIARDGVRRIIADSAAPIRDANGVISGVVLVVSDVTAQYQVRAELSRRKNDYRLLFEGMLEGFALHEIICDASGRPIDYRFLSVNPAFEQMTGLRAVDVVGRTVLEILPEIESVWVERYGRVALTGEPVRFQEYSEPLRRHFEISAFRPRANEFAAVFQDVTERKQMQEKLFQTQRLESIGSLASGIAHDLNNILAPIMFSAALLHDADEETRTALIATIAESAKRGANVVNQVLAFARGAKGERTTLDLKNLVDDVEGMIRKTFPKNIAVTSSISPDLWLVEGDSTQIHQVLLNLCINARDAMPNGGCLCISGVNQEVDEHFATMVPHAKAGNYAVLGITDNGTGIPRELLSKIFDPFFTTKEVGKGTGLGLSTAIGILLNHGGFITVDSEEGRGSAFKVFLPSLQPDPRVHCRVADVRQQQAEEE